MLYSGLRGRTGAVGLSIRCGLDNRVSRLRRILQNFSKFLGRRAADCESRGFSMRRGFRGRAVSAPTTASHGSFFGRFPVRLLRSSGSLSYLGCPVATPIAEFSPKPRAHFCAATVAACVACTSFRLYASRDCCRSCRIISTSFGGERTTALGPQPRTHDFTS